MQGQRNRGSEWSGLALLASGAILVGSILAGYWLGQGLDSAWETGPRWSIVGAALGTVVGFWQLYRTALWVAAQQPPIAPGQDTSMDIAPAEENLWDEDDRGRSS